MGRNPRAGSSPAPGSPLLMTDAQLPNKRLKLTGGDRSKGIGMLFACAHSLSFSIGCAGGRVARSLSAIR